MRANKGKHGSVTPWLLSHCSDKSGHFHIRLSSFPPLLGGGQCTVGNYGGPGDISFLAILRFSSDCLRSQIPKRTLGKPSEALKSHGIVKIG